MPEAAAFAASLLLHPLALIMMFIVGLMVVGLHYDNPLKKGKTNVRRRQG